jgi:uncharacterized lipoprotein YddW (UPF0748 family)
MLITAAITLLTTSAAAYEVAVLRPNQYLSDNPGQVGEASRFLGRARALLDQAGLEHHTLNEDEVRQDGLPAGEFFLCAYNPGIPTDVEAEIVRFLDGGGHALFCYYLSDRLRGKLQLGPLEYAKAGEEKTMEYLAAGPKALRGQPKRVRQSSWNAHLTEPRSSEVRVAARWSGPSGRGSSGAGLLVGPQAAFLGHVLTEEGHTRQQSALLVSIVSHYHPHTWGLVAKRALYRAFEFRHAPSLAALDKLCASRYDQERLARLKERRRRIDILRRTGRADKAFRESLSLREDAEKLYLSCLGSRKHEFRGAWVVMPGGVGDWSWDKTARVAHRNGLNALFVRVEWRGQAHYRSEVLRVADGVTDEYDPLAEAVEACHRYGLEVHAWFINHNWRTPPKELIEEFSAQGRWQVAPDGEDRVWEGGDRVYWVNPSDPRNVKLQADMMSEVARNYDVDGVHFDYIRYENYSGSYGEADRERFERKTGLKADKWPDDVLPRQRSRPPGNLHEAFLEWRVTQISNVVEACSRAVRAADPDCKLSAAVYPAWPAHRLIVGQDWPRWLREGWIDFVCPMNYDSPSYYSRHEQRVIAQRKAAGEYPLYSGIGSWLQPDATAVADQIVTDRANGADGFLLFSYTPELGTDVLPKLRRGPLRSQTRPPARVAAAATPERSAAWAFLPLPGAGPLFGGTDWLHPRAK